MMNLAGKDAKFVVVINSVFGDKTDFYLWHGDGDDVPVALSKTALTSAGGLEITLNKLQTGCLVALDEKNMQFGDALAENSPLTRSQRSRIHKWVSDMDVLN